MKKKLLKIGAAVFLSFQLSNAVAQAPQKMSYQAVIRNASNALVASSPVGMQISILQGSPTGTPVYVETQSATTNTNGLVTVEIGNGTAVTGTFSSINWAAGPYYIMTETDPAGGTTYSISGTTQLMSVPYALYAETSGTAGPQGPQGVAGADGANGLDGAVGPQGPQGPAGANGLDGAMGPQGPQGPAGADGLDGAMGPQGPQGPTGPQGPAGMMGMPGMPGGMGPQGPQGPAGTNGTDGAAGADGATGPQGPQGVAGANGADGVTGATGATGATGLLPNGSAAGNTPYWNGTDWVVNSSNIFNNGGNVGIGASTPSAKLDVYDAGNLAIRGQSAGTNSYSQLILANPERILMLTNNAADDLASLFYAGTNRLQFNLTNQYFNVGNVGIGTGTPNAALQFGNVIMNRRIVLWEDANNEHNFYGFGINGNTLRYQVSGSGQSHAFYAGAGTTSSNELLRIQGDGKVGIGTSAPSRLLNINSAGPNVEVSTIYTKTGSPEYVIAGIASDADVTTIGGLSLAGKFFMHSYNSDFQISAIGNRNIEFGTNGVNRMYINSTGRVGIGTTAPTSQLQVVGLPVHADNTAAIAAGLTPGAFYRTATGVLMVAF